MKHFRVWRILRQPAPETFQKACFLALTDVREHDSLFVTRLRDYRAPTWVALSVLVTSQLAILGPHIGSTTIE